ncbi:aldo/keto reductase [Methylobacterium bullatum]|uniref:1-deoxyxylulose-5-phosphate synthase YajO n=1 Tax=Methylobacterium bullatum TaxID=570505 RepID=A0A679K2W2_9HYPH|nr:aldo/keto reductase [Methylobacterium bullatum]MBD8902410.1 aldo/keto reductase [Methylobacterium bullatum]GJD38181.1 1-deoxyxylulose-5-phosphate synthase YajO [Methylobacterium bullatum]CAA2141300.1 L-glyceraldehyde 3-phosphate reductase [Methylobacterium bullatum]
MDLTHYRSLGRSGLAVSPLALGTMTFGAARWGLDEAGSRAVFDAYVERGGNFVDTADVYASGGSETMVGRFVAERGLRDRLVLATKSGFATGSGPHAGGCGAKHVHAAIDGSLRRLGTDYIDLYWLHVWDGITPAEELLETMVGLVRAGKVRYWGLSNTPAWYAAKLATLAASRGLPGPIALQYFYSLVNREVEDEHIPLAAEFGMGMVPWSPLAYGLLTGKYDRATVEAAGPLAGGLPKDAAQAGEARPADDKRLDGANPFGDRLFTPRNWDIVEAVRRVADAIGQSPARVALAWVVGKPGVASTLMGVSRAAQVADNVASLGLVLEPQHRAALDAASMPAEPRLIYALAQPPLRQQVVFGGAQVHASADISRCR